MDKIGLEKASESMEERAVKAEREASDLKTKLNDESAKLRKMSKMLNKSDNSKMRLKRQIEHLRKKVRVGEKHLTRLKQGLSRLSRHQLVSP